MTEILTQAIGLLERAGLDITEVRELSTGLGWQLRCPGGEIVAVYRTGKLVAQGSNQPMVKALLATAPAPRSPPKAARKPVAEPSRSLSGDPHMPPGSPQAGASVSRFPAGWTTAPWDGVSVPFDGAIATLPGNPVLEA